MGGAFCIICENAFRLGYRARVLGTTAHRLVSSPSSRFTVGNRQRGIWVDTGRMDRNSRLGVLAAKELAHRPHGI